MWIHNILLALSGFCFGAITAGGVFTVLVTVGLIPRFAGRTRTAGKVPLYENMIIIGTIVGVFLSIFDASFAIGRVVASWGMTGRIFGTAILLFYGAFAGIFEGALAMAIAEMLNAMPIFFRRLGFGRCKQISTYLKPILISIALGKTLGAVLYFMFEP